MGWCDAGRAHTGIARHGRRGFGPAGGGGTDPQEDVPRRQCAVSAQSHDLLAWRYREKKRSALSRRERRREEFSLYAAARRPACGWIPPWTWTPRRIGRGLLCGLAIAFWILRSGPSFRSTEGTSSLSRFSRSWKMM